MTNVEVEMDRFWCETRNLKVKTRGRNVYRPLREKIFDLLREMYNLFTFRWSILNEVRY